MEELRDPTHPLPPQRSSIEQSPKLPMPRLAELVHVLKDKEDPEIPREPVILRFESKQADGTIQGKYAVGVTITFLTNVCFS